MPAGLNLGPRDQKSGARTTRPTWRFVCGDMHKQQSEKIYHDIGMFNTYHAMIKFSRWQIVNIFFIFPRRKDLTLHANFLLTLGDNLHEMSNPIVQE